MKPLASGMGSGPRIVDVEALLGLPEVNGFCTRGGKPHHLRSIADPRKERVVRFACKSWACRVCSARLRRVAGEHYATRVLESSGVLFADESHPAFWERDKKRMERRKCDWVRLGCLVETGLIIGCSPTKHNEVFVDKGAAIARLGDTLRLLSPDGGKRPFRPVNSSRSWRPEKKAKRFTRVGWVVAKEPREVVEKLVGLGINPASIRTWLGAGNKLWDCIYDCPPEMKDAVSKVFTE